jgi:hypothetical protein
MQILGLLLGIFLNLGCKPDAVATDGVSARLTERRLPGETYDAAEARFRRGLNQISLDDYESSFSVKNTAAPIAEAGDSQAADFGEYSLLETAFRRLRDFQFVESVTHPEIVRRSTWLYPDDGCFARADLAVQNLAGWNYPQVEKVFIFGDLSVATANSPSGGVSWWFHVAPLARVGDDLYVLDPAVHPDGPLTLTEWTDQISDDPTAVVVSFCGSTAYSPYSRCDTPGVADWERTIGDQKDFLDPEWDRLVELGRDPKAELGESPPWKTD